MERQGQPARENDDGKNSIRLIKSRSGHTIKLNDEAGKETIEITDKSKKNSILIDTSKNTITITSEKDITLAASNGHQTRCKGDPTQVFRRHED